MPKYVIAGGQFTPFSYDELIKPVQDSAEAHLKTQEALDALAMQAGDIASQIGIAEDGQNSKTLELYNRYEDLLRTAGEDLYNNGYNAVSARGLSLARQAYGRDITKIQHAIENRAKMAELYRKAANSDPTYMAEFNPATRGLDNWIDNPQYGDWRYYSGNTLVGQGNQLGSHIHDQLREDEAKWRSILGNQYYERWIKYGVTAEEINDAVAKMKAGESSDTYKNSSNANQHHVGVLMDAISNIYNSSKMGDWADNQTRDRAYDFIGQGLYSGIAKPEDKVVENKDFISEYQRLMLRNSTKKSNSSSNDNDLPTVSSRYWKFNGDHIKVRPGQEKLAEQGQERINQANIVMQLIEGGIDLAEFERRNERSKDSNALEMVSAIRTLRDTLHIDVSDIDAVKAYRDDALRRYNSLVTNYHRYMMNGRETVSSQVVKSMSGNLNGFAGANAEWADGKKGNVSAKDYDAIVNDQNTKIEYDPYEKKFVFFNPNSDKGSVYVSRNAVSNINGIAVNGTIIESLSPVYDELDEKTKTDLANAVEEYNAQISGGAKRSMDVFTNMTAPQVLSVLDNVWDLMQENKSNVETYNRLNMIYNTLQDNLWQGILVDETSRHQGESQTSSKNNGTIDFDDLFEN